MEISFENFVCGYRGLKGFIEIKANFHRDLSFPRGDRQRGLWYVMVFSVEAN